mmetsp:Transcript_60816/g.142292  ORF Transcript_60816/g.142292 Transcript_60816/m.142292 type:complete len:229 (-) Transcript_60816:79-765(-)
MADLRKGLDTPTLLAFELHGDRGLAISVRMCERPAAGQREPELKGFVRFNAVGQTGFQEIGRPPVLLHLSLGLQWLFILDVPNVGAGNLLLSSHVLDVASLRVDLAVPLRVLEVDVVLPWRVLCPHVAARPSVCEVLTLELTDGSGIKVPSAVVHDKGNAVADELLKRCIVQVCEARDRRALGRVEVLQRNLLVVPQEMPEVLDRWLLQHGRIHSTRFGAKGHHSLWQ